jgi:ubiquinone/menaquinone biosynthesis C-methylase UbiE
MTKGVRSERARDEALAYDRALAERYWGGERLRLAEEFKIVLSAGEPRYVNAAYHRWETETLARALGDARGVRVLDLACGLGRVSRVLAARGANVVGVDNAFAMLEAARRNLGRQRARARLAQAASHALPFAGASFRAVVCFGLLEHLPLALQESTLAEAFRVLAPGGALFLVLNNNHSLLLASGEDNRFRRAEQLENGYFCGLVDRRQLTARLARRGARVRALGSNAHYSLLRHGLRGRVRDPRLEKECAQAFAAAAARDLAEPRQGFLGEACADHFVYRIERPRAGSGKRTRARSARSSGAKRKLRAR